jgi:cysteinyl-tRNA synthetase
VNIKLYNSLEKKKQLFQPLVENTVNFYACGVTVYDHCHIGHGRSLYIFEVLRGYLKHLGFKVNFVRNITDIDDKIINRAQELNIDWHELVDKYIESYHQDLRALAINPADSEPRATQNIDKMIEYIHILVDKGYAYVTEGGVYFNVAKFSDYGKLSGQKVQDMRQGVRIGVDSFKKQPLDFALWKISAPNQPGWDSPWGRGRPGWHIECSVMSQSCLGVDTLDIHGGGRDLIFPHHENEIAQAQALTGKPFARYWLHHGLLTINRQKMAKSLGNFVTIKDVVEKYSANALKIFYLQAHYSSVIDFSWAKMQEADKAWQRVTLIWDRIKAVDIDQQQLTKDSEIIQRLREEFYSSLADDFNTPQALAVFFNLINSCNKLMDSPQENKLHLSQAKLLFSEIIDIFGFVFDSGVSPDIDPDYVEQQIALRKKYKQEKNFVQADKIRNQLNQQGIILEDTKEGTRWRQKR